MKLLLLFIDLVHIYTGVFVPHRGLERGRVTTFH
jgi:hypothetical protein